MATTSEFVEYVHEQSGLGKELTYKKMFGEYALYIGGKVVALACDNSLYVKPTEAIQQFSAPLATKAPYPGAKPHVVADELLDDSDGLKNFLLATAAALPAPKSKTTKKSHRRK
jgi:TfoX/Sxy family transcriptional regulator of competence genes